MSSENEELIRIRNNNIIVAVSAIIVIAWFIANKLRERDIRENIQNDNIPHYIRLGIFIAATLINIYFVRTNYRIFKNPNENRTKKTRLVNKISLTASVLFLIAGITALLGEIINGGRDDENIFF